MEPMPYLEVLNGPEVGQKVSLTQDPFFLGRDPNNHLPLTDRTVSRKHAVINLQENQHVLNDLKSLKGVLVNGVQKTEAVLEDGDEIAIGAVRLRFYADPDKKVADFLPKPRKQKWKWVIGLFLLLSLPATFYFLKSDPKTIQEHYERGIQLFNNKDTEGARNEWEKVLELDPERKTDFGEKALKLLENLK